MNKVETAADSLFIEPCQRLLHAVPHLCLEERLAWPNAARQALPGESGG